MSSVFIPDNGILPHCEPSIITSPDNDLKITSSMVITAIKSLKNSTSIGLEGFSNNFVNSIACHLASPRSKIFSLFLQQSYCPIDWKPHVSFLLIKIKVKSPM